MTGLSLPAAMRSLSVSTSSASNGFHHSIRPDHLSLASEISGPSDERRQDRQRCPAERDVDAVRSKRAADAKDRVMGVRVDDPVVALAGLRVVDLRVVEHVVGAERAHEVELLGAGTRR